MLRTLKEKVQPGHAALLVIDMQNDSCHEEGFTAIQGRDVSLKQKMLPQLVRFLSAARKQKLRIIFVQHVNNDWTLSEVGRELLLRGFGQGAQIICEEGSWGAGFYEVKPLPDEPVITKHRYSAFMDTNLDLMLRSTGIKSLILTGVATNACVESTARDGFMKDYYVVMVSDCTAAESTAEHEAALLNIRNYFGAVASSDKIMALWDNTGTNP